LTFQTIHTRDLSTPAALKREPPFNHPVFTPVGHQPRLSGYAGNGQVRFYLSTDVFDETEAAPSTTTAAAATTTTASTVLLPVITRELIEDESLKPSGSVSISDVIAAGRGLIAVGGPDVEIDPRTQPARASRETDSE
jgi:hypothetical protein